MKNIVLESMIAELKKSEQPIWKRVATDLKKPSRNARSVNLSRIEKFTKADETAVVPGKVLGSGILTRPVTVIAYQFSDSAASKIKAAGGKALSIEQGVKANAKNMRIIG